MKASVFLYRNEKRIKVEFHYSQDRIVKLREISDSRWSRSLKTWHIPYSKEALDKLKFLFPEVEIIVGKKNPGGDIMIHGNCVTIGCIPLTDDKIKEVYLMAVEARNKGQQNIQVHIFPARFTDERCGWLKSRAKDEKTQAFWNNLKDGYSFFENKKNLPSIAVDQNGKYLFE